MQIITLTKENLEQEHICCSIANKTSLKGVEAKKRWLSSRIEEGLRFKKADIRGKVFIEYLPAENAWMPIIANNYMHINCFWVSGSHKGKGYGKQLLEACEADAKDMNGITVVVGNKKKPYLSDKAFFLKHGFEVCDTAAPYFELLVKRFDSSAPMPRFNPLAKEGIIPGGAKGIDIFYTPQCPFTLPYTEMLKPIIMASDTPIRLHEIKSGEEARAHYCAVTTYSLFINGQYYVNEILTPEKLSKLLQSLTPLL